MRARSRATVRTVSRYEERGHGHPGGRLKADRGSTLRVPVPEPAPGLVGRTGPGEEAEAVSLGAKVPGARLMSVETRDVTTQSRARKHSARIRSHERQHVTVSGALAHLRDQTCPCRGAGQHDAAAALIRLYHHQLPSDHQHSCEPGSDTERCAATLERHNQQRSCRGAGINDSATALTGLNHHHRLLRDHNHS